MTAVDSIGIEDGESLEAALVSETIRRMKDPMVKLAEDARPYFVVTTTVGDVYVSKAHSSTASAASIAARDRGYRIVAVG